MRDDDRVLLFHYHLFKNAGTSVDEMLKDNFGHRWDQKEFSARPPGRNALEVEAYLRSRPDLDAFSSHTANLPLPVLKGRKVFPLFFLRHPIDRIRSAYAFERKQQADTFGAALAKQEDFAGYARALLEHPTHRQTRNFQTYRLAFAQPVGCGSELERAQATLAALPFIGLVETFEPSLERLQALLEPLFPGFEAVFKRKNVTQSNAQTLQQRLERIAQELGPPLNDALWGANADDLALFESVREQYAA